MIFRTVGIFLVGMLFNTAVLAADVVSVKGIGMDLARDIANEAVQICKKQGYHVTAVVVDRHGLLRVALRDDLAARFTLQIAEQKANAAVMSGIDSGIFRENRKDIRPEMNHVEGILMMQGGVLINAGGFRIGAVGVSGAPGGEKDEVCAKLALKTFQERLEFAE
ncbi:MAG: heme-binding protein [Gammaproteobacteria bacterium]|nr:heme-binding protein [Gammaproteobacteria bacterium]